MKNFLGSTRAARLEVPYLLVALTVLAFCVYYGYVVIFQIPWIGFTFSPSASGWRVVRIETCAENPQLCGEPSPLQLNDVILVIDGLDYDSYYHGRIATPFGGLGAGDVAPMLVQRGENRFWVDWILPDSSRADYFTRAGGVLLFIPFWIAGVIVLLFLQPRDERWYLLLAFNFLTAAWVSAGPLSLWQAAYSSVFLHLFTWLLMAVLLHLHLAFPSHLIRRWRRPVVGSLYAAAGLLAALEILGFLPLTTYSWGFMLAVTGSVIILVYRFFRRLPGEQPAVHLMLSGIILSLGPALFFVVGLYQLGMAPNQLMTNLALVSIPALPFFYTYAVYKRRLGALEFRANRVLGVYAFGLVALAGFVFLFAAGARWLPNEEPTTQLIYTMIFSLFFVLLTVSVRPYFQGWVNRVAYGARHDPAETLKVFASQIPGVTERRALARLVANDIVPSLLIRESALFLRGEEEDGLVYSRGVSIRPEVLHQAELDKLLTVAGRYQPEPIPGLVRFEWVRLAVGLRIGNRVIGVWLFGRRDPDDFYPRYDIELLTTLANQIAPVLATIQLLQIEAERRKEAELLAEIGEYLASTLELEEVLKRVVDSVRRFVPDVQNCSISILERGGMLLRSRASWSDTPEHQVIQDGLARWVKETLISSKVLSTGQPVVIEDLHENPATVRMNTLPTLGSADVRSVLYVPLLVRGEPIGILHLHAFDKPRRFRPKEVAFCANVANQAATAIENARLYHEARERANELSILYQVSLDTAAVVEADPLLQQTTDMIVQRLSYPSFGFLLLDETNQRLVPHPSFYGLPETTEEVAFPLDSSALGRVVLEGQPLLIGDVQRGPLGSDLAAIWPQIRSQITVPVRAQNQVIGVLCVLSPVANAFSGTDLRFLTTLGSQVAAAVERAQLYRLLQHHAARLADQVHEQTAKLRAERDRTRAILHNAGEGIFFVSPTGIILYANPAALSLTGYEIQELSGRPIWDWFGEQLLAETWAHLRRVIMEGRNWSGELAGQRKSGGSFDARLTLAPTVNSEDEITGFVGVLADITRLREVDRLRSEFIANVSHELRTPLTNIKTYLVLLQRGKPENHERHIAVIEREATRLTRLIEDLLDFSERQSLQLDIEPVELPSLVEQTVAAFAAKAEEKGVRLKALCTNGDPVVEGDAHQLGQVLANLVNNAIAYTPAGGQITVTADIDRVNGGRTARLEVADTGMGIAAQDLPFIFERFYRGRAAQERSISGTGLGLAITQEIVEKHGGSINVHSKEGQGAVFTVWLPLSQKIAEPV